MKKIRYVGVLLLIIFATAAAASAKNVLSQILGAYQKYQEINMTLWLVGDVGAEKRFGKELQFWMGLTQKPEKDPKINAYVKSIFNRLLPNFNDRGMKYDIRVIRENSANAFVIPGGHVYVHTGLLDLVGSDDELAAVISHELAHAERRHSLRNFRASTVMVALLNKAVKNKRDRETWGALLSYLTLMKFSRQQEDEADDIGQMRLAKSGFNPAAQVTLWEKFLKKYGDNKGLQQYLSSHPPSSQRVQNARNNLAKMNVAERSVFANTRQIMAIEKVNLVDNHSFEATAADNALPTGWEVSEGKAEVIEQSAVSGRKIIRMLPEKRNSTAKLLSDYIAVKENSDLTFSVWGKSENGEQNAAIGVELYDANKRLRNRVWAIRPSAPLASGWQKIEGRLVNSPERKIFAANNAYMRLVLQTGPFSEGSVFFDDLDLKPFGTAVATNLLQGGDFERARADGLPEGILGDKSVLSLDYAKFNSGYASLLLQAAKEGEVGFAFAPFAVDAFKKDQQLVCSFYFQGDRQQKGAVIVEYLDDSGKPLARRLAQVDFEAIPDRWQATSFSFKHDLQGDEEKLAKMMRVRVAVPMGAAAKVWFDTFVMR